MEQSYYSIRHKVAIHFNHTVGNTIEHDVKSSQVKVTILKRTNILLKGLRLTAHINSRCYGQRVCGKTMKTLISSDHVSSFNLNRQFPSMAIVALFP